MVLRARRPGSSPKNQPETLAEVVVRKLALDLVVGLQALHGVPGFTEAMTSIPIFILTRCSPCVPVSVSKFMSSRQSVVFSYHNHSHQCRLYDHFYLPQWIVYKRVSIDSVSKSCLI